MRTLRNRRETGHFSCRVGRALWFGLWVLTLAENSKEVFPHEHLAVLEELRERQCRRGIGDQGYIQGSSGGKRGSDSLAHDYGRSRNFAQQLSQARHILF